MDVISGILIRDLDKTASIVIKDTIKVFRENCDFKSSFRDNRF